MFGGMKGDQVLAAEFFLDFGEHGLYVLQIPQDKAMPACRIGQSGQNALPLTMDIC